MADYKYTVQNELVTQLGYFRSLLRSETGEDKKDTEFEIKQIEKELERRRTENSLKLGNKESLMITKEEKVVVALIDGKKTADYQGWKNYETWNVALWIDNDQGLQEMAREWAQESVQSAPQDESVAQGTWSVDEAAKFNLADRIKEFVEEQNPLASDASMYSDILSAALQDVDWSEVAEHYLEDLGEEETAPTKTEEASMLSEIDNIGTPPTA